MTIKENDKPHLWQLIKEIRGYRGYSEDEYGFEFVIRIEDIKLDNGLTSTVKDRRDLMVELEKLEAIKIMETKRPEFGIYPFLIKILQPKFGEIYQQLEEKFITKTKPENNKFKFPHKLPAGTIWENFTIKFFDSENIFIQVKQFKHEASYKEMGFVGKGNNPNPSETWTFLKVLAQVNGELTLKDPKARDKYKKQKELLAKSLQDYFSLDYDPFYPYHSSSEKEGNSYKIKITLISPPAVKETPKTKEETDDLGLKEYLDEQAPQMYEDE